MNRELYNTVKSKLSEFASINANYKIAPYLKNLLAENRAPGLFKSIYRALYDVSSDYQTGYLDWSKERFNELYKDKINQDTVSKILDDDFEIESILLMGNDSVLNMVYNELETIKSMGINVSSEVESALEGKLNIVKEHVIEENKEFVSEPVAEPVQEENTVSMEETVEEDIEVPKTKISILSNISALTSINFATAKRTELAVAKTASIPQNVFHVIEDKFSPKKYKDEDQKLEKQAISV